MWPWMPNGPFFPLAVDINDATRQAKSSNEHYDVYVNGKWTGVRESVSQGDGGISAVKTYLESRGFEGLDIREEGDHINIITNSHNQEEDVRRHLSVYLNIR